MTAASTPTTTSDERVMAALSHFFGMIAALIVWALHREKSRFIRFQSLQALAFEGVVMVPNLAVMFCMVLGMIGLMAGSMLAVASEPNNPAGFVGVLVSSLLPMMMFSCIMPFALVAWIGRILAAASVANGGDFHYPILGRRVEAWLGEE